MEHWSELSFRDKAAYISAIITFSLGWVLVFIGFFSPPIGEISGSVLSTFGMSLSYAASVFGIGIYFSGQLRDFKRQVNRQLNKKDIEVR